MNLQPDQPVPPTELTPGTHLSPRDGTCLMEWVSVLAGEPWTDNPTTTHPLVAHLARLVNDAMSQKGRQELVVLASRLKRLDSRHPAMTAELAALATACARKRCPGLRLAWMHGAAQRHRRLATGRTGRGRLGDAVTRLRRTIYGHGPAHRAVETAVVALARTPDADHQLRRLLEEAVDHLEARSAAEVERDAPVESDGMVNQR